MTELIASLIAIAISSALNSEMDTIAEFRKAFRIVGDFEKTWNIVKRKPWRETDYWCLYQKPKHWLLATFADGWHLVKGARIYFYLIPVALIACDYFEISNWYALLINVPLFVFNGAFFELFYE